jgi:hypothetical protein
MPDAVTGVFLYPAIILLTYGVLVRLRAVLFYIMIKRIANVSLLLLRGDAGEHDITLFIKPHKQTQRYHLFPTSLLSFGLSSLEL